MEWKVYKYRGIFKNGIKRSGIIVAKDRKEAISLLSKKNIYVTRIYKLPDFLIKLMTPSSSQLALMFDGFLKMTRAGIDIESIIENLINEQISPAVTIGLHKMLLAVREGYPIPYIFRSSEMFSSDIIAIIESGSQSGRLENVYENLKEFYQQRQKIRKAIISAVSYPVVVILLAFFALLFIAPKVLTPLEETFKYIGAGELPVITVVVMSVVNFLKSFWWLLLLGGLLIFKLVSNKYKNSRAFKKKVDKILLSLPIYGELITRMSIFRFILTLSLLYRAGIPISTALKIATNTQFNEVIKEDFEDMNKAVDEGQDLAKAIRQSFYMPDIAKSLITIGQESGAMSEQITSLKDFMKDSFNEYIVRFNKLMQPVAMILLGILIAVILTAVYLPLFSLIDITKP